jgi:REP element-mobilizing transposase RayT
MNPIYTPDNTRAAFELNWGLTLFWRDAPLAEDRWLAELQEATEPDGVRILKHRFTTNDAGEFFVSTKPHVSPPQLIRSVKGRLQHLIRATVPKAFQRNYCVRSVGSATREVIEQYVANQLTHHPMADAAVQQRLAKFQKTYPGVDLSQPCFSAHGMYWHNLHVVIVNEERWMEIDDQVLSKLSNMLENVAAKHGHRLSRVGLLPDHIHVTMGCPIEKSPQEIALGYLNNCAYACGMKPVYKFSYYVGTFGSSVLIRLAAVRKMEKSIRGMAMR